MTYTLSDTTPKGQRDAITADRDMITVEAGAGTGKTWVLSQRYLHLLLNDDELLPSDILTLTFTEAAAGEMKERIEKLISGSLEYFPNDARRQKILDGLSDSWISTIHAFATRLIRESGLSLDIDPRASVISAHQEQEFWEDIRNAAEFAGLGKLAGDYTKGIPKEIAGPICETATSLDNDGYMSAAAAKWGAESLSTFARITADLHASRGKSWREMLAWAEDDSELLREAESKVIEVLRPEWRDVWELWKNIRLEDVQPKDKAGNALNDFLDAARANPPDNDEGLRKFYDIIVSAPEFIGRTQALVALRDTPVGKTLSAWRDDQPKMLKNITASFDDDLPPEEKHMRTILMKFCAVAWGMWDIMKSKRGLLSFSDMILHAGSAIGQNGIRKTFRHILVDEFQDTDRLQFDMIEALKGCGGNPGIFAVGDPKQSIYRFRHADPSLFADVISREGTQNIPLDQSFRTRATLLERINFMFSSLWRNGISRDASMRNVMYNTLKSSNSEIRESGTMPDFRIILADMDKGTKADDMKALLADTIAQRIFEWVSDELTVWDKEAKIIRPVKYSDFAVLLRGRKSFGILEDAFEKYGIPTRQDRSNDYFNRGEIGDVVCTLRAAANIHDDFSVAGWLMSPFSGVNEDEAVKCLAQADENHRPIDLIRANLPDAYKRLEYLCVVGENEGASGILATLDKDRHWLSCIKPSDRLRVLRNVMQALRIAREFQQSSGTAGLVSCAEYMTRSIKGASSFEEAECHDEDENAVKLGAVHSAKGLEYPVTVIFEDRTRINADNKPLRPSRDLGIVASTLPDEFRPSANFRSKLSDWEKLLSGQGDLEEEQRLFYVACTRARDSLIFCGYLTSKGNPYKNTWTQLMLDSVKGMNDSAFLIEHITPTSLPPAMSATSQQESPTLTPVKIVKAERALRQISATSFALFEWCPYAWRRKYRQGLTLEWERPDRANNDDTIGGAELGSLAHWVLSKWLKGEDIHRLLTEKSMIPTLPGYLRDTWRENYRKKDTRLEGWLLRFAASDLGVRLKNTAGVETEYRFRQALDASTFMAGAVDVLYGNNVVDYKITAEDNAPSELYDSQTDFYAYVLHVMKKAESVNTCIAFLREGSTREREISCFDEIRGRIEHAAKICASYEPNHNHCGECPFKKGCAKNAGKIFE